jgi:hypothetical protein
MTPPGDRERDRERTVIEQLRQTIELIKRESAEQTQAIASLKNGFELLQVGKKYEQKEVTDLIARLSKEMEDLTKWRHYSYKEMWEGDNSINARLKEIERTMTAFHKEFHEEWEPEVRGMRADVLGIKNSLPDLVDEAIARRDKELRGRIKLEHTKGFWVMIAAIGAALISSIGVWVKYFLEVPTK